MPITTFKRYEIKFLLNQNQLNVLLYKTREYMKPDSHCRGGVSYCVHNIYFDTEDGSIIRNSLAKPHYKEKLRLRSYVDPACDDTPVFLELKKKICGIVHKKRAVLPLRDAMAFVQSGSCPEHAPEMGQVVNEISYFLDRYSVSPAIYLSYQRIALTGLEDPSLRVTFDFEITTRREDLNLKSGSYGYRLLGDGLYLMEVKVTRSVPLWLADLLAELSVYKTSFSKYGREYRNFCLGKAAVLHEPGMYGIHL